MYKVVAGAKDQTAFLAITLLTVLGMSGFTQALGLSDTLGAFLAGVLLAETKYRYQIEADIAPFRGLLLGLFFITTGFSIDVGLAVGNLPLVLGFAFGLHALKTLITFLVGTAGGLKPVVALRSSLILSQVTRAPSPPTSTPTSRTPRAHPSSRARRAASSPSSSSASRRRTGSSRRRR